MPASAPEPLLVTITTIKGAMRLAAVSPEALAAGLAPGMALADARARLPHIDAVPEQADLDAAFLNRLRGDFERFTPLLSSDAPNGLMLDITGCAHLWEGEAPMATRVRQRARAAGLHVCCAIAGAPQAARALARFSAAARGAPLIVPEGGERKAIAALPVAALELPERDLTTLLRAGLKQVGDVMDRDSISLASRFGGDFPTRIARLTGVEDSRITPVRPPPPCMAERVLHEPVVSTGHIETLLRQLLHRLARQLESQGMGGLCFEATFYRTDGQQRRIAVRLSSPGRDPGTVIMLLREKLNALDDPLDPGFGFDQIRISVTDMAPLAATQQALSKDFAPAKFHDLAQADLERLTDRLTARLGAPAVLGLRSCGSHLPDRSVQLVVAQGRPDALAAPPGWREPALEDPPLRPLHMFRLPQPVEAVAEAPDGHPLRFRWRRATHDVAAAEGPERIAAEWWRTPDLPDRDYYRVEDSSGRRFWLFREGIYGGATPPCWFIHGLFA